MTDCDAVTLSVIIPVYNAETTIQRTLASLTQIDAEHRARVEVVVINDGSTDGSADHIRRFRDRETQFQFAFVDQPNRGVGSARNAGLEAAQGEWVFLLDADDELALDLVPHTGAGASVTSVAFAVEYRRGSTRTGAPRPPSLGPHNWLDVITARNPLATCSLLFRRSCISRPFVEDLPFGEDWLFWMSNPALFENMKVIRDTACALVHIHGANVSTDYRRAGHYRAWVANHVLDEYRDRLTRKQRNNLTIQKQIGRLQQRELVSARTFFRWPCSPALYAKLWVYAVSALFGYRPTPFRPGSPDAADAESNPAGDV